MLGCLSGALSAAACRRASVTPVDAGERIAADADGQDAVFEAGAPNAPVRPMPRFPSHGSFEGTLVVTAVVKTSSVFVLHVKGAKTRLEMPGQTSYVIHDRVEHWGVTVSPAKKTLTRGLFDDVPFDVLMRLTPSEGASIVATGQADTVAGAICNVYRVREAHGDEYEACLVSTPFAADGAGGDAGGPLAPTGVFSLRTIVRDDGGAETNRMEVTKIEEKALDPSLFLIPAGYREVTPEGLQR
jgi:hypothetical protein